MSAENIAELLYEHREGSLTCHDHPPTPDRPVWCCVCGAHELATSWRDHVAEALAPLVTTAEATLAELVDRVRRRHPAGDEEPGPLAPGNWCPGCGEARDKNGWGVCRERQALLQGLPGSDDQFTRRPFPRDIGLAAVHGYELGVVDALREAAADYDATEARPGDHAAAWLRARADRLAGDDR